MRFAVEVPFERLQVGYRGKACRLSEPRAMNDPGRAFKENPHRKIVIDLAHEGVGPIYGHVGKPDDGNDFARAHYEQHMKVSGTIEIEGKPRIEIRGHGLRDHSWGPRYWQSTPSYRWITGNFGDDLGMVISIVGDHVGGVLHKGQELLRITGVDLETDYESGTNYHSVLRANVTLSDGAKHRVDGRVRGFIPLRNRRAGQNTHIGEGMTEYTLDGERIGYGLSEYLDQGA